MIFYWRLPLMIYRDYSLFFIIILNYLINYFFLKLFSKATDLIINKLKQNNGLIICKKIIKIIDGENGGE
jgi:hypothetical protein